jgi:hypothetical protein
MGRAIPLPAANAPNCSATARMECAPTSAIWIDKIAGICNVSSSTKAYEQYAKTSSGRWIYLD